MSRSFRAPRSATLASRAPRSPRAWALAGCLLGALPALLTFAPAQWLAQGVERVSGGQVLLAQARGTVWTGSAQVVLTGGHGSADQAALPGRLQWQVRPAWTGLRALLSADCCTAAPLAARITPRWGGVHVAIADGQSQWPAAVLSGLGTPFNTLQPQGQLALRTQGLALDSAAGRLVVEGQAQLDALGMSSRLSTLRPMGSYRLALRGGEVTTLTLSTLDGALRLTGSGRWIGQRLRFEGEATAAPEREGALANLLNIIGRRTGARSLITVG
ncbi:type II secretion system protein N [Acidovorax sp. NCPPB 2350]|nr:type II secretion system protein N [Acidovorax sp. NCPPB 2350]